MVLSIPLTDTLGTIHRLEIAEILVSLGVIIAMSLLGAFSIRLGLSPLERMRAGARAITAGDTSARVEESGPAEVRTLGG
ncbi:histidine kinase, partial [mine drainage metagenome]